jgi:ABC-type amino acid transport substrate-binding protein
MLFVIVIIFLSSRCLSQTSHYSSSGSLSIAFIFLYPKKIHKLKSTCTMTQFHLITPGTLTVGTYSGFAPVSWHDDNGVAHGKDIDFLRAFAAKWNLNIVIQFFPFDQIWKRTANNEIDIAAAGLAPLESRKTAGVVWSEPYYTVQRSLLIRATDLQQYTTIDDFANKVILVTTGSTAQFDTEERKPETTRIVYYDGDQAGMVSQLLARTVDALAEGDICSRYLATARYSPHLAVIDVHPMKEPEDFVFAVREESGDLLNALNAFILANRDQY